MTAFRVDFEGLEALFSGLENIKDAGEVKKIVKTNSAKMQEKSMGHAPVDTGHLKRSITLTMSDGGLTGTVESTASYAVYQEYGTRYQPGKAHIRPAFYEQVGKFIGDIEKLVK